MNILRKARKDYENIEVPEELNYIVNRTINQSNNVKNKKRKLYIKGLTTAFATSFALFVILLNTNESFAKAMEDVPILDSIAKVFTIREYTDETENELVSVKIPGIENTGNTDLENRVNYEILNKINKVVQESKDRAEEYKNAVLATGGTMDDYSPIQINVDYEITYQDNKLISFVITKTESMASAYGEQYFYNIDLENGKELNLRDVLGENYKEIIDKEIKKQIKERSEKNEDNMYFTAEEGGFSGIENEYHDFYISSNKKVVIVFQKYEIAPGYMGIQYFEIPNDILI